MRKSEKKKRRGVIGKALLVLFMLTMVAGLSLFVVIALKAPPLDLIDAEPDGYRTSVLDKDGAVVLTLSGQESNRVYVKLSEVPEDLQHAFVALEDSRFYTHHGVDLKGIARAAYQAVRTGSFSEGASTITQQLLKNNVFTDWTEEKTFWDRLERKIQEQYLAVCLEGKVDKDWILENYLNTINLGGGNWGVQTASKYYFNKDVSALTLSESAVIAGITKNPTTYNPLKNPDKNAIRREKTLRNMLEQGYITEEQYNEAMADPVYDRIAEAHASGAEAEIMTYFEDALIYDILDDLMTETQCSEEAAWNLIYRGGLTICSTEDSSLQAIAEEEVNNLDHGGSDAQVSLVLLDNKTGEVRALIGGRGEKTANLLLDRAVTSLRQPGSTVKILGEYAAGLESGTLTLGTAVDDAPYTYSNGTEIHNADGIYGGMTTVRQAIIKSDNIVAVKCLQEIGVEAVYDQLQDFGLTTLDDSDKVEALALGGTTNGVTNMAMTAAYSSLARDGIYIEPVYYTKVLDHDGNVLLEKKGASRRAVNETTADLLTSAMEDVMTQGTGIDADFEGMALAGKSGTTSDVRDAWFIGYSPYYTCGVWGGYDDNRPQENSGYVKTIWKAVMSRAHVGQEDKDFDETSGLKAVKICTKSGKIAVEGVCDHSPSGDVTMTELFVPGTEPTETCDCHIKVTVCRDSGKKAGSYCPSEDKETKIYLKEATEGTTDVAYVIPEGLDESSCDVHTHFWSSWFEENESEEPEIPPTSPGNPGGTDPGTGSDHPWWQFWNDWDLSGAGSGYDGSGAGGGNDGSSSGPGADPGTDNYGESGNSGGTDPGTGNAGSDSSGGSGDSYGGPDGSGGTGSGFLEWLFGGP